MYKALIRSQDSNFEGAEIWTVLQKPRAVSFCVNWKQTNSALLVFSDIRTQLFDLLSVCLMCSVNR